MRYCEGVFNVADEMKTGNDDVSKVGQALLITVDDTVEADILESKLQVSGIPVLRQYRETGAYLTLILGKTSFGVDMYVPKDMLEEARNIIASAEDVKDEDILSDPSFSDESLKKANEEFLEKMDRRTWWMAGFFFAAVAIILYIVLVR